jgi:hypothetical protein
MQLEVVVIPVLDGDLAGECTRSHQLLLVASSSDPDGNDWLFQELTTRAYRPQVTNYGARVASVGARSGGRTDGPWVCMPI